MVTILMINHGWYWGSIMVIKNDSWNDPLVLKHGWKFPEPWRFGSLGKSSKLNGWFSSAMFEYWRILQGQKKAQAAKNRFRSSDVTGCRPGSSSSWGTSARPARKITYTIDNVPNVQYFKSLIRKHMNRSWFCYQILFIFFKEINICMNYPLVN